MDGFETCQRLKAMANMVEVPIIFVTAKIGHETETLAFEAGAVDFINKPVNPDVVRARVRTHLKLKFQADLLRNLAQTDGLTGVANRRNFDETLQKEWQRCRRSGLPLSLIYVDVDYFKAYNDCYGHQMGDVCLQAIAHVLMNNLRRPPDLVARYGGEEFVCLLPETPLSGAITKAHMLEKAVRALDMVHQNSAVADVVTISLGVATVRPASGTGSTDTLLSLADQMLYQAKRTGRGRVCAPPVRED
jgi:diguanylate cyclase (GGDEF)-like protein